MADDGVADDATHDEPDPSGVRPVVTHDVDDQEVAAAAATRADHPPDVTTVGEPMRRGEHGRGSRAGVEPRGLRPPGSCGPCGGARTRWLRPARVRMRSRKPCTLWRRRLFGWYVRLLTRSLRWWSGAVTPAAARSPVGDRQRWSKLGRWIGASAGTAHPRAGGTAPGTSPGGAWTCGTRRHRVTDERYARRLRGVKSRPRRGPAARDGCGYRPSGTPPAAGSVGLPTSLWIASCSGPRGRGYVRPSSSFPAFGSDQGPAAAAAGGRRRVPWPLTCGDPVSAGPP